MLITRPRQNINLFESAKRFQPESVPSINVRDAVKSSMIFWQGFRPNELDEMEIRKRFPRPARISLRTPPERFAKGQQKS